MKFLDSVQTWIENPRYVEFNNWFYKQNHENVISLMVTNNRTIWGWLKQYAFETENILLEILSVYPLSQRKFRARFSTYENKTIKAHNREFDTIDEAIDYLIDEYFNRKGDKPLEGKFMKAKITGYLNGKLLAKDRQFLKQNIGKILECKKQNTNYIYFSKQNCLCHVFDCTVIEE